MDDSSEVVDISCSISCLCPLSFSKVQIPTRGRNCRHLQFFDKSSFLELYGNRGYGPCPICLNEITISDLVVDPYIQHLLDTSSPDQKQISIQQEYSFPTSLYEGYHDPTVASSDMRNQVSRYYKTESNEYIAIPQSTYSFEELFFYRRLGIRV